MASASVLHIACTSTLSLQVLYIDPTTGAASAYPSSGVTGIPTYSRFEIGVLMPVSIQQQIDNFLSTAYNQAGSPVGLNPYDPNQIKIQVDYTLGTASLLTRYGFYYREISPGPHYATYNNLDPTSMVNDASPWLENQGPPSFRVRFAPPTTGHWAFAVSLLVNNAAVAGFTGSFMVTPSGHPGFLVLDPRLQKMTFAATGKVFFGIGQNIAYALGDWSYSLPALPYRFNQQRLYIADLAAKGGNFARIRLDPWSTPVETVERRLFATDPSTPKPLVNCLTNFDHNQRYHWEMDRTLAVCESHSVYVMLNLLLDSYFSPVDIYGSLYAYTWENNPYRALLGPSNCVTACGAGDGLLEFFNSQQAQDLYGKQLFYIHARWGYSPHIAIWEHINETDNLGTFTCKGLTYFRDCPNPAFKTAVMTWVSAMQSYLDTLYPPHLQTTGFGGYPFRDPHTTHPGQVPTGSAMYEVFSANQYGFNSHFTADRSDPTKSESTASIFVDSGRAFVLGEIGMGAQASQYSDRDFHNSLWAGAFSGGIATPLYWEDWDQGDWGFGPLSPPDHRANFKGLSRFFRLYVNLGGKLYPNQVSDPGQTQNKYVDNYYLSDAPYNVLSATYAYGWCQNRSYWAGTDPDEIGSDPKYATEFAFFINTPETVPYDILASVVPDPKLLFNNLQPNTTFELSFYETVTGHQHGTTITASSDSAGHLAIPIDLYRTRDFTVTPRQYPDFAYTLKAVTNPMNMG